MPIRMEKDTPGDQGGQRRPSDPTTPGSGGRNLINLLPFLLMFLFKRPKILIPILAIAAIWYVFFGSGSLTNNFDYEYSDADDFAFGATLSEVEYDKAEVFEALAMGSGNQLPARASLESFVPRRLHQGRQGSCSGWASAYGARTISFARANSLNPNRIAFSPSYLYNQIAFPGCQGAYMRDAMEGLLRLGSVPFAEFGYDDRTCQVMPDQLDVSEASRYRIKGYNRLTTGAANYTPDLQAIKQNIAQGAPVVIGMMVGNSFMNGMVGSDTWNPNRQDYSGMGLSGHAMCVVGYDDHANGGAFRIMNSWGENWGDEGMCWVRYQDFKHFVKEAYGLYPEGQSKKFDPELLEVKFGLVSGDDQSLIPLMQRDQAAFRTSRPIRKGDRFKVAITNTVECYIYVFGMETDGSSYVLFPYTSKHSPYCGITGTRLFPRDYSMVADQIGSKDYMAIVVTKHPINFEEFNGMINRSSQQSYAGRIIDALGAQRITDINVEAGDAISFQANTGGKNAVGFVIEIDKI